MSAENEADNQAKKKWLKRIGVAGFLFFLGKGLLWLLLPILLALGWVKCD